MIEVLRPGPLTTIQDLGRPGLAALGVGPSGAADRRSAALANRLVGNLDTAACLETTYGGLSVRFAARARVAVTGAPCPITRGTRGEAMNAPFTVVAGETVTLGPPSAGVRSYLAVRGGIGVEPILGSRSTDVLSGVGPTAPAAGTRLPIGTDLGSWSTVDVAPVAGPPRGELELRILPGPRDDWFAPEALTRLVSERYTVSAESNRVGARLDGPALTWAREEELPSEGTVVGAIQVPPSGLPVIFLADHPVTGGYPVIGVLVTADVPVAAQAVPGQRIRFRRYSSRR
ncbi:biotin-dependent carboxyltransferase family protein [Amycolatopsis sp. K13G38]|uniref:Biotin-dependent carboxyltransferase family protein n=1 Tax=Amycolatopsis acididurans TaxID=2724524 RepID=A0ABX1J4X9_9PSEU|nr:biotin-dependent carboxyltransferase family protein [Amycolatopsis acididurans]NKQ54823.1 biotin-dependent carboxyltransferase family protein [Amycolatopsis acididurans]